MGELAFGGSFNALDTDGHPVTHWMDEMGAFRMFVSYPLSIFRLIDCALIDHDYNDILY
jgi:hypothetical protein